MGPLGSAGGAAGRFASKNAPRSGAEACGEGTFNDNDLMLLRHEIYEANYERTFNSTYREAHEAALKAGYVWEWKP